MWDADYMYLNTYELIKLFGLTQSTVKLFALFD